MRSFVAASCCAIVGLEILIGVPVAVCLGFFCFGSEFSGTYVAESQYQQPMYAPMPYTPSALPSGKVMPTFDPYVCPPPLPALCPAPASAQAAPSAAGRMPPAVLPSPSSVNADEANAVAAEPSLNVPTPSADQAEVTAESLLALRAGHSIFLSVDDAQQLLAGGVSTGDDLPLPTSTDGPTTEDTSESKLLASLRQTARLLYRHADRREESRDYDAADSLRTLARRLLEQAEIVSDQLPDDRSASVPSTGVTVGPPPRG